MTKTSFINKTTYRKHLGITAVLSALLFGSLLFCVGMIYASPGLSAVLGPGSMVTESTMVIFKDGVTYYARDGDTGAIVLSDTNASYVFNSVTVLTGEIFVTSGSYYFTHSIILYSGTKLCGEGISSKLYLSDGANVPLIRNYNQSNYGDDRDITVDSLSLNGNSDGQTSDCEVIHFRSLIYFRISNNFIADSRNRNNIFIDWNCHMGEITNNIISESSLHGIEVYASSEIGISNNIFNYNYEHMEIVDSTSILVVGNTLINAYGLYGIEIHKGTLEVVVENVTITGNIIKTTENYAIYVANVTTTVITANILNGNPAYPQIVLGGSNSNIEIAHNIGFVTENMGFTSGTGAEQTIAHGLSGIPDYVFFGDVENGANPYQSSGADTTNIYLTAVSGKDYVWYAVYVP